MRLGDLVEFSGESYEIRDDDEWEWQISAIKHTGIITLVGLHSMIVTVGTRKYSISNEAIDKGICSVDVISSLRNQTNEK